jgi:hypothetical protein
VAWAGSGNGSRAAIAALVLGLVIAGCQSNPEPPPLDRTSASSSLTPSPSPTDSPPPLPHAARGTSEASAKAFVRHWIDALNYAGPSADVRQLRELSAPDCTACEAIGDFIAQVQSDGGVIRGAGWKVLSLEVVSSAPDSTVVDAHVKVAPQHVRQSRSSKLRTFPGGIRLKTFWLRADGSSWKVTRLDQPQ